MNWLNRLRALAQRMCVAPANYAQADLDALQRVGDPGLSSIATNGAGDIVDQILGVTSTRGATLVGDGPLTGPAVAAALRAGPDGRGRRRQPAPRQDSADGEPATADVSPVRYTPEVVAAPFDPTVGAALAGVGHRSVVAVVSRSGAGRSAATRLDGRAPPGRARLAAVAQPCSRTPSRAARS